MAVLITNDAQLIKVVGAELTSVIDEVAEWLLNQIIMSIEANVYSYPEGQYERLGMNGGFIGAWGKEVTSFVGNYIQSMVGIDPLGVLNLEGATPMVLNGDKHQHGNLAGEDRREEMASLIETGTGYDFGGNAARRRDFWSPVIQMVNDGSLDEILETYFKKHNIQFIKNF